MKTITKIRKAAKELNMQAIILEESVLEDVDDLNQQAQEDDFPPRDKFTYWIEVEAKTGGQKMDTVVLQSEEVEDITDALDWLINLQYTNPYDFAFYLVINYEGADCVNAVLFEAKQGE